MAKIVGMIQRLVGARVEKVEQRRLSLVETALEPGERTLTNVPAEMRPWPLPDHPQPGIPVLLFATDRRLLWALYNGRGDYKPVVGGDGESIHAVPYERFRSFYAFPAGGGGGFGFLLLSDDDLGGVSESLVRSLAPLVDFLRWSERTMGPGSSAVLAPAINDNPQTRHLQMFAFRQWTPIVESFVELVSNRANG